MSETTRKGSDFEQGLANSDTRVADFSARGRTPLQHLQHFLHGNPTMVPVIVLLFGILVFGLLIGGRFFNAFTMTLILQQVAIVGIVGVAQTLIILTAGIDLSVGAIMVLSSVIMGNLAVVNGVPAPLALTIGLAVGTLCGALNGFLVARVRLPPFIVTLGTWFVFEAINFIYTQNATIRAQDVEAAAPMLQFLGRTFQIGGAVFTYAVVAVLALVALFYYILNTTAWGRHVYAIGDDEDAARLSGIRSNRVLISVYAVSGLICAFAGWALIGRIGSVSPTSGYEANIQAITAVVIGGTSLFGGRGSVLGTLVGALIVGVFAMGLRIYGTDPQWTRLTVGALIILAVAADQWIRKVSA
ncbi:ABC transporter permease [Aureimonas jatrophae]|jgi:fructose transport system permease protein|uniref:Autoinducer 2 import system permease protein LsrD n=1 Tax=Aureimonas jatrophae TaxID=1166073 RepID=A0A1H0IRP9_9HYPH|nr:ABC transporter permease [Aureimonas jatrophae]MBB3952321.1 fructose transport system permease protein [Aureimonas jatrophae]SDO33982.1 mannose ABC transporter membrane protein /fructose ABC transporter membrane protein /ribose ABC transporter membrane protein [Aureimonas jatrophae]